MDLLEMKLGLANLSESERLELLKELEQLSTNSVPAPKSQGSRRYLLDSVWSERPTFTKQTSISFIKW